MATRTDPARLAEELLAAGIPAAAFSGCRSGGPLPEIAWNPGHPTPAEWTAADVMLTTHDPDRRDRERRDELTAIQAGLDTGTTTAAWRNAVTASLKRILGT